MTDEYILTTEKLTPSVRKCLQKVIEKEGFTSYKVNVKDISTNGGNYLGLLQTVTVKSCDDDRELNLFLKNIIHVEETLSVFDVSEVYQREGFFYSELVNSLKRIQDKYNIPQEDRFNTVKGYGERNDKVIILDDISKDGYKTYNRLDVISLRFAELSIKQLAKLHAISFVLQKEHPRYFENNIKPLGTIFKFNDNVNTHLRRIFDKALETLEGDAKTKLDNYFPNVLKKYQKYLDVPEDEAICLLHGDFRANNILVKEIDGVASKVMPVDYQFLNYGCPVTDFIYFVFTATDQQFRKNHIDYLKEMYYSNFEIFLGKFGIEAREVYPKKQFEEEYRDKLDYGLICFLVLMPFIFAKTDDFPDMVNGIEAVTFNLDECYKDRLQGIVDDFIEWGYL